jgi:glycosyltransferase involved in cell wall biosynthesis
MRFCIVTPCRNAAAFIDETIFSVISRAGPFTIRYHVQDGGSTDAMEWKLVTAA